VRTMILATALFLALVPISRAELMVPVAMAGATECAYIAYDDGRIFKVPTQQEVSCAYRGIGIKAMCFGSGQAVFVLYEDDQVWEVAWPSTCQYWCDMTRPDGVPPVSIATGSGLGIVGFYEDGQIWISSLQILRREQAWERPVQPTPSETNTWGTVKGAFR
jgi:hypothetical protein